MWVVLGMEVRMCLPVTGLRAVVVVLRQRQAWIINIALLLG